MRIKEKPNKLFEDGPDWEWEANLKHWFCVLETGHKAFVWVEWLNPPATEEAKLSKSNDGDRKLLWDGICMGVPGGPEPSSSMGPLLAWIRRGLKNLSTGETHALQ
jgi:hypothetical protein